MTMSGPDQESINPGLTMIEVTPSWADEVEVINQRKLNAINGWMALLNSVAVTGRAAFQSPLVDIDQSRIQNG